MILSYDIWKSTNWVATLGTGTRSQFLRLGRTYVRPKPRNWDLVRYGPDPRRLENWLKWSPFSSTIRFKSVQNMYYKNLKYGGYKCFIVRHPFYGSGCVVRRHCLITWITKVAGPLQQHIVSVIGSDINYITGVAGKVNVVARNYDGVMSHPCLEWKLRCFQ